MGKRWNNYSKTQPAKDFVQALATDTLKGVSTLISVTKEGKGKQGTWIHPQVAIHLAQWCSPEFAVVVSGWIFKLMTEGPTFRVEVETAPATLAPTQPDPMLAVLIKQTQQTNELIGRLAELSWSGDVPDRIQSTPKLGCLRVVDQ